ncbi:hypothetical protein ACQ4PT_025700 [Festuca glaucescens]
MLSSTCTPSADASEAVFWSLPCWDTASWNSMIGGSTFNGLSEVSARYFRDMARSAIQADEVTLSSVLSASARADDLFSFGKSVHGCVVKSGYEYTASCSVPNSLMTFYSELGFPEDAEKVFLGIPNRNLVSWNAMIKGLVENEKIQDAISAHTSYSSMHILRSVPLMFTFASVYLNLRFSRFIRWPMPEPELFLQWDLPAVKVPGADPPCDAKDAEQRSICTAAHSRAKEKQDRAVGNEAMMVP